MQITRIRLLCAAALILGGTSGLAVAAADAHHAYAADAPRLKLNAGKKWATDAPLRQAMDAINAAMLTAQPLIHAGQFSDADYIALAASINQSVVYAIENCRLPRKADAMLHLVIAELTAGAEMMEGRGIGSRHEGAERVMGALQSYARYFQHPGFRVGPNPGEPTL